MDLSPKQIVYRLDKYIIGQKEAKKSVAIALRNRYRRSLLSDEMREQFETRLYEYNPVNKGIKIKFFFEGFVINRGIFL